MKQEIAVVGPDLSAIPGWISLNRGQQDWLLERDEQARQYRRLEGMASVAGCLKLMEIEEGLKGTEMSFTSYLRGSLGQSERTAWRKLKDFKELLKQLGPNGPAVAKAIAANGNVLLRGVSGSVMKDLVTAAKLLPPPKNGTEKVIEGYIANDLREKLRELRRDRRPKEKVTLSDEQSAKIGLHLLLRSARGAKMKTSAEKRHWLQRVGGWFMEAEAIHGTVRIGRIPIPDGTLIRRGYPRGRKRKKRSE